MFLLQKLFRPARSTRIYWLVTWLVLLFPFAVSAVFAAGVGSRNLVAVDFSCGKNCKGYFRNTYSAYWEEGYYTSKTEYEYREQGRDNGSVFLYDQTRNLHVRIDMKRKKIVYRKGEGPEKDLYNIISGKSDEDIVEKYDSNCTITEGPKGTTVCQ